MNRFVLITSTCLVAAFAALCHCAMPRAHDAHGASPAAPLTESRRPPYQVLDVPTRSVLAPGSRLLIVSGADLPVEGARVSSADGTLIGTTGADGLCELPQAPSVAKVTHQDHAPQVIRWENGAPSGIIKVTLRAGLSLRGRVVDQDGAGLASARVVVSRLGVSPKPVVAGRTLVETTLTSSADGRIGYCNEVWTSPDGTFSLDSLHPGAHRLLAVCRGYVSVDVEGSGSTGVVFELSDDQARVDLRLYRVYFGSYRMQHGDWPVEYAQSCLGTSYGYPEGLKRLRQSELDEDMVRQQLRERGFMHDIRIFGISHAKKDSRIAGPLRGHLTANVLGTRLGQQEVSFTSLDDWDPTHACVLKVPVPPPEQVILETETPVFLLMEGRRRQMFFSVSRDGMRSTFLVPRGNYQIRPIMDLFLGKEYVGHAITVPTSTPIERPLLAGFGRLEPHVLDIGGERTDEGMISVHGNGVSMQVTPNRLKPLGRIPVQPGRYRLSLAMSNGSIVDRREVDVADGSVAEVALRWQ